MNTTEKIVKCLNDKLKEYKKPVTILSKTNDNTFIIDDTIMLDWDEISELYGEGDESSSVDAIYCFVDDNELTLYLFEFKNQNLHDPYFDAKKQLNQIVSDLRKSESCQEFGEEIKKIKKNLVSKKIVSLKTKPIESLILLHKILNDNGISSEEIVMIRKEYYVVSTTPISGNKSNWHRRGRNKEIFGFIDKIKPFPFTEINHISEKSYFAFINTLKIKNTITEGY